MKSAMTATISVVMAAAPLVSWSRVLFAKAHKAVLVATASYAAMVSLKALNNATMATVTTGTVVLLPVSQRMAGLARQKANLATVAAMESKNLVKNVMTAI